MLRDTLSVVLPSQEQTWLLQACLWSGERGEQAWTKWSEAIGDSAAFLRQDSDGVKGLLPLLFYSLQDKDVIIDKEFHTYLRTAYLRDELRSKAYSQICRDVTSTLDDIEISVVVLKGAALAETVYSKPVLQHSHYLDILVHDDDLSRSVDLLSSLGFTRSSEPKRYERKRCEFIHDSGLPLVLHRQLFGVPFFEVPMEEFWARSRIHMISGVPVRLLSPADNLFHICGSIFDAERHESLRWVCDAWFIIRQYPNLDWDLLLNGARRSHTALPLLVAFNYLAEELNAPIPPTVLNRLRAAASTGASIGRELALFGVLRNARGGLMKVLQNCGNWSTRALVVKCALFPSPRYVRWYHEITWSWLLPFYYAYRPLKFIVRQIFFFCRRAVLQELSTTRN